MGVRGGGGRRRRRKQMRSEWRRRPQVSQAIWAARARRRCSLAPARQKGPLGRGEGGGGGAPIVHSRRAAARQARINRVFVGLRGTRVQFPVARGPGRQRGEGVAGGGSCLASRGSSSSGGAWRRSCMPGCIARAPDGGLTGSLCAPRMRPPGAQQEGRGRL